MLLINEHPEQRAFEVVYVGVVPEARGRGYSREMLLEGIRDCARLREAVRSFWPSIAEIRLRETFTTIWVFAKIGVMRRARSRASRSSRPRLNALRLHFAENNAGFVTEKFDASQLMRALFHSFSTGELSLRASRRTTINTLSTTREVAKKLFSKS